MPIFKYFIPFGFKGGSHIAIIVFFSQFFLNEKHIKYSSNILYVHKLLEVWVGSWRKSYKNTFFHASTLKKLRGKYKSKKEQDKAQKSTKKAQQGSNKEHHKWLKGYMKRKC